MLEIGFIIKELGFIVWLMGETLQTCMMERFHFYDNLVTNIYIRKCKTIQMKKIVAALSL